METILAVAGKLGSLLLLVALGYIIGKKKYMPDSFMNGLSAFLSRVVVPIFFITNLQIEYSPEMFSIGVKVTLLFILVTVVAALIGWLFTLLFRIGGADRGIWIFGSMMSNHAFMGFPIFLMLFGAEGMFYAVFVNLAMNVVAYTAGVFIVGITAQKPENKKSLKQLIVTPLNIGILVGLALFLLRIELPDFVMSAGDMLTGGMSGMAMVFVGYVLSRYPIMELVKDPRAYIISFLRLVVLPLATYVVMRPFVPFVGSVAAAIIVLSTGLPLGSITVPIAAEYSDDPTSASRYVSISTILCLITLPLVTYFLV